MVEQVSRGYNMDVYLQGQAYELFMQAPAAISVYKGANHTIVLANDFALQLSGKTRDAVIGKPILEVLPEIESQGFIEILNKVLATGEHYAAFETPIMLDIGGARQTLYLNLQYKPFRDVHNVITGVIGFATDVTAQVMARKNAQDNQQKIYNILKQAPDPICILKTEKLILEVANKPLLDLWNIDEHAIGKSFLEILPEMKEQGFYDALLGVYHKGEPFSGYEIPVYFNRSHGTDTYYFNFVYHPYREADNNISGVLIMATDVTEQVAIKKKISDSQGNFITLVMQAPIGICILSGKEFFVEVANDAFLELAGKAREDFVEHLLWDGMPEAKSQGFDDILKNVMATGIPFKGVEWPVNLVRNQKAETVYVDFVYQPLQDGNDAINKIMGIAYDVTDKVVARRNIESAEQSAQLAFGLADLGTYEISFPEEELVTSPRFNQIFDLQPPVTIAQLVASIHPEDRAIREKAIQHSRETGYLIYEVRVVWSDGAVHWVRVRGRSLRTKEDSLYKIIGVVQDITEHKMFADALSKKVAERTQELFEANTRLSKSNAELEQFAFITSHDLQEPLRKIQVFSDLALDDIPRDSPAGTYLQKIGKSAKRLTDLIKNLLDYSRISKGAVLFEQVDLNEILKAIIVDFELAIHQRRATIEIEQLTKIQAVPLQMNQLFYNLIGNALKFSRKGVTPIVKVTGENMSQESIGLFEGLHPGREYYKIEVKDNGVGFNQKYASKIFTIFQQLNNNSIHGGYGIGLAICHKIVQNHKGIIYATGKEQEGSCFTIILPLKHD